MSEVAEGVERLGSELVNFYVVVEDGARTVVDAGFPGYWPQVAELAGVEAVVLTHAHVDHVGVAERLRSERGARVLVHEADEQLARTQKAPKTEGSVLPSLFKPPAWRFMAHGMRSGGMKRAPIGEVDTFADGEVLDVPGRPRVVHVPGHTDGSCALHFERHRALFVGDAFCTYHVVSGRRGPLLMPSSFNVSNRRAMDSLARIEGIDAPVTLVGHGEPWRRPVREAVSRVREEGFT